MLPRPPRTAAEVERLVALQDPDLVAASHEVDRTLDIVPEQSEANLDRLFEMLQAHGTLVRDPAGGTSS